MKNNKKYIIEFELIIDEGDKLVGGFSQSHSSSSLGFEYVNGNNCMGGNCTSGCGSGQNVQCNAIAGCGTIEK